MEEECAPAEMVWRAKAQIGPGPTFKKFSAIATKSYDELPNEESTQTPARRISIHSHVLLVYLNRRVVIVGQHQGPGSNGVE